MTVAPRLLYTRDYAPAMNTTSPPPDALGNALELVNQAFDQVQKIPGSSIVIRYIRSSYQNDPVRSAMELFLFLFAVYYLVSPSYSTKKQKQIPLTEEVRRDHSSHGPRPLPADTAHRKLMSLSKTGLPNHWQPP